MSGDARDAMTAAPTPPASVDSLVGHVVDGRYRVIERIGQGGMGVVFKVEHTKIGKIAALKVLHANLVNDREVLLRFQGEAEAISKLSHPNIVQVFDFGRYGETAYLVMEYLRGEDLGAILRRDGALTLRRCVSILAQVCDALSEAHDMNVIHRDLKPENIRVSRTKEGRDFVKVLDFGLAKIIRPDEEPSITAQGSLVGTPYYMAPEQIRATGIDHRADIYSIGAVFYHLLTGRHAFTANTPMGVLTRHLTDELVPPSRSAPAQSIAPDVDAVVAKAMAKHPDARYANALALKQALLGLARPPTGEVGAHDGWLGDAPLPLQRASDADEVAAEAQLAAPPVEAPRDGGPLSREDLAFERRLQRGLLLKLLLLLPLLAAGALAIYWFGIRTAPLIAPTEEIEPNNEPQQATLLAPGQAVRGRIGSRVSGTESDRDWFVFHVDRPGRQILTATLGEIPNMDLTLELYDALGGRLTAADSAGTGGAEQLTNWPVGEGKYLLLVREMWRVGSTPTENVTDWYRLQVRWSAAQEGWEVEPNDLLKQANRLAPGATVRGYLGALDDVDHFTVHPPQAAKLSGSVSGIPGVDLVLEVRGRSGQRRAYDEGGASVGEAFRGVDAAPDAPVVLVLRRKDRAKPRAGETLPGLARPYSVSVTAE